MLGITVISAKLTVLRMTFQNVLLPNSRVKFAKPINSGASMPILYFVRLSTMLRTTG